MRDADRTPWPAVQRDAHATRVAVVTVNSNTRRLVAHLVFSLYRVLGLGEFAELVVVDNASTDGSRALLRALSDAGFITLLENSEQRYHGPGLTQGVSWLASKRGEGELEDVGYVWLLDSDVVVLRSDTVREAIRGFAEGAAMVGQPVGDPKYDRLLARNDRMLQTASLLIDPGLVWHDPLPPFVEDGAPSVPLQLAADNRGLTLVAFPFVEQSYVVHLGRGTLEVVAEAGESTNRYYEWALAHRTPHYSGDPDGPDLHRRFCELFDAEVPELEPTQLVDACNRSDLLSVT